MIERVQVELVREDLSDDFKQIFLSKHVAALDNLFQQGLENRRLVGFEIDQLTETNEVAANQQLQLLTLLGTLFTFSRVALVLESDPELVHLDEVCEDEVDGILKVALGTFTKASWQVVSGLTTKIVAKEETANGMLDTSAHLHHVLHNLLDRGILDAHVDGADGDHEVETRDNVAGILDELVEIGEVVGRV